MEKLKTSFGVLTAFQTTKTTTNNSNNQTTNTTTTTTRNNNNDSNSNNNSNKNNKNKTQLNGYIHAIIMLFCFGILLGTTYTEQQPYTYSSSHQAIMVAINKPLAVSVSTVDEVWNWIETVVGSIGGDGIDSINANCQYYPFNSQEVTIDGRVYTLGDPAFDTSACSAGNVDFITGSKSELYLTGNHQLLSFGIFALRSVPQYPVKKSVKHAKESTLKVRSSEIAPLNPLKDDKVVEVCNVNWGTCLHKDGYHGEAGSTFGWDGRVVDGYYTFKQGSSAYMILTPSNTEPAAVEPCFVYGVTSPTPSPTQMPTGSIPDDNSGGGGSSGGGGGGGGGTSPPVQTQSGSSLSSSTSSSEFDSRNLKNNNGGDDNIEYVALPGNILFGSNASNVTLSNCEYKWVSSGYDLRVACLLQHNIQPTALLGYLSRVNGYEDVNLLMDSYFGCNSLFTANLQTMSALFVTANKCLESNILGNLAYGVFFSTENQEIWIRESVEGLLQLKAHNYIDDNTRTVRVYFITRSLGTEQLFYSIITVEFQLGTDGSISSTVTATYVPMIMYQYGYGGYEWRTKDVFRFEVLLLILFVLFTIREIYQLITIRLVVFLPESLKNKFKKNTIHQKKISEPKSTPIIVDRRQRSAIVPISRSSSTGASGGSNNNNYYNNSGPSSPSKLPQYQPIIQEINESMISEEKEKEKEKKGRGEIALVDINGNSHHSLDNGNNNYPISSINQIHPQSNSQSNLEYTNNNNNSNNSNSGNEIILKKPSELLKSEKNDIDEMVDEVNDKIEEFEDALEDILEDYTPDSAGIHDMLDWTTIVVILIGIIYRVNYIKSAAHLHSYLVNLEEAHTYDQHLEDIVAKFSDIQNQERTIHLIAIAVIAVGMLQFFRYLSFNKRFGIVTTTIAASTGDLLPVLVIFVSIVIAYAILASEIYGIQLEEYSTVQTSLAALFIMLLGNFDYYASKFQFFIFYFDLLIF